ncbi:MAG: MMPL family transporter, partial [Tistlia sp.]
LRFLEEREREPDRRKALAAAGAAIAGALGLSAVAAAAGFLSFLPTDYRGLAQLGLISGAGMACALLASFTVLPAALALPGPRATLPRARRLGGGANAMIAAQGRRICLAALLLGLGCAALLPALRFDFNPINLKDPETESVATFHELAAEPNSSVYTLELLRPDLPAATEAAERLRALPEVGRVLTLQSFVPEDQEPKLNIVDAMASYLGPVFLSFPEPPPEETERAEAVERLNTRLGETAAAGGAPAEAAARLRDALARLAGTAALAEYEDRLFAHFPGLVERLGTALEARPVGLEDVPQALRGQWIAEDGRARVQAFPAGRILGNEDLGRFADAVQAVAPEATGTPIVVTQASRAVVTAFVEASLIAFAAIVVILLVVLRRLDDTLLVLAPLLLAALLTAAASVLLGLAFNFANVIVLPLLLGLGVSAGIHLVLRRREGAGPAVMESSTPRAVLFSALTTLASFGSLALSGHRGMTSMGQLLTVSIVALLLATLVVLPALMAWLRPAPGRTER